MPNRLHRRRSLGALLAVIGALCVPAVANATVMLPGENAWNVHTKVVSKDAFNMLAYGLSSPRSITVCSDCAGGETASLGAFAGGTELTVFLSDTWCGATFQSSGDHTRLIQRAPLEWGIEWDDAGGPCGSPDLDFNDLIATINATYQFSGLRSPIDVDAVNVAKASSAIPVKFSLNGNAGLDVFAGGSPTSRAVACASGLPTDLVEETANAAGAGLTYDSGADQYSYVWKTSKAWVGTCRELNVKLNDGSSHTALFSFR
jgi:hypothetical protein